MTLSSYLCFLLLLYWVVFMLTRIPANILWLVASHLIQGCGCYKGSSVPSIVFYYTLWTACASVLRQLLLDLGLQSSFNILKSNYLRSPKHNGLIEWAHNPKLVTNNYCKNKNIKNKVEGIKVPIKDKQWCFCPLFFICFQFHPSPCCAPSHFT